VRGRHLGSPKIIGAGDDVLADLEARHVKSFTMVMGEGRGSSRDGESGPTLRPTGAIHVGTADGDDVVVVFVGGEYWLAHIPDTDYDHGTGATPAEAVEALRPHLPPLTKWAMDWDYLENLASGRPEPGLAPPIARAGQWTSEDIIAALRTASGFLGRAPEPGDAKLIRQNGYNCPPPSTVSRRFGSWRDALNAAGIKYK
jgi:hypothetical protein